MKKFLLSLFLVAALSSSAFAANVFCKTQRLKDSSGVALTDYAISASATVYTQAFPVQDNVGYLSILVVEDKAGGAGDVEISAEYSVDGTNFYTVNTTSAGTLAPESPVADSVSNETAWIQHTARLAKYVRYKIVAAANSEVTFDVIYQQDR